MTKYKKGMIVRGFITGIEKYGAFMSLPNYYSGLIHISEMSDGYVRSVQEFFNIGDYIYAKVLEVDEEHDQVKLTIKDIDYKENGAVVKKVKEVGRGFLPLEENLDIWIKEKLDKIEKN